HRLLSSFPTRRSSDLASNSDCGAKLYLWNNVRADSCGFGHRNNFVDLGCLQFHADYFAVRNWNGAWSTEREPLHFGFQQRGDWAEQKHDSYVERDRIECNGIVSFSEHIGIHPERRVIPVHDYRWAEQGDYGDVHAAVERHGFGDYFFRE